MSDDTLEQRAREAWRDAMRGQGVARILTALREAVREERERCDAQWLAAINRVGLGGQRRMIQEGVALQRGGNDDE